MARCPVRTVTRLLELAAELARFGDAIAAETEFDPRVFRVWQAELLAITAELQRQGVAAPAGGGQPA